MFYFIVYRNSRVVGPTLQQILRLDALLGLQLDGEFIGQPL